MSLIDVKPRIKEGEKKPTRYYSTQQEKQVAKKLNAVRTKNSGATFNQKGDVIKDDWLIECKTKEKSSESISIKKEWLEKNNKECVFTGKKYSAICFNFGPNEKNYYIIDEETFQKLIELLKENN